MRHLMQYNNDLQCTSVNCTKHSTHARESLVHLGDDVRPNLLTVRCPGIAIFPLVPLVDLMAPDHEHERSDHGQVVGHQVCQACGQHPAPLYQELPKVVRMPDHPPPPRHYQLPVPGSGHCLQVGQARVGGVLGKLTSVTRRTGRSHTPGRSSARSGPGSTRQPRGYDRASTG